jgi:hypothetical protein
MGKISVSLGDNVKWSTLYVYGKILHLTGSPVLFFLNLNPGQPRTLLQLKLAGILTICFKPNILFQ